MNANLRTVSVDDQQVMGDGETSRTPLKNSCIALLPVVHRLNFMTFATSCVLQIALHSIVLYSAIKADAGKSNNRSCIEHEPYLQAQPSVLARPVTRWLWKNNIKFGRRKATQQSQIVYSRDSYTYLRRQPTCYSGRGPMVV